MSNDRWEYKVQTLDAEQKFFSTGGEIDPAEMTHHLNRLGGDGWELISCFDTNMSGGITRNVVMVFKRELRTRD